MERISKKMNKALCQRKLPRKAASDTGTIIKIIYLISQTAIKAIIIITENVFISRKVTDKMAEGKLLSGNGIVRIKIVLRQLSIKLNCRKIWKIAKIL